MRVDRTSHTTVEGRLSKLVFDYRLEEATRVRIVQEVHELGLFTPPEMLASFQAAGLAATMTRRASLIEACTSRGFLSNSAMHRIARIAAMRAGKPMSWIRLGTTGCRSAGDVKANNSSQPQQSP